jgi:ABC-type glycerol-3-phosphate transport system permease component
MYGYMKAVDRGYSEAAFIDGASHAKVFFSIMMPQALPPILTLSIMSFIGAWNDYITPLLYMPDFPTIASGVYRIKISLTRTGDYPVYFSGLLVSMIPVLAIFIGFSKTIMQNFTVGGLKG